MECFKKSRLCFAQFLYRGTTAFVVAFCNVLSSGEAVRGVLCQVVGSTV